MSTIFLAGPLLQALQEKKNLDKYGSPSLHICIFWGNVIPTHPTHVVRACAELSFSTSSLQ